jgi:hypothetical protein
VCLSGKQIAKESGLNVILFLDPMQKKGSISCIEQHKKIVVSLKFFLLQFFLRSKLTDVCFENSSIFNLNLD